VIGGLVQNDTRVEETKVPILGDIPILGWLFKSRVTRDDETALIVFLTPWIVRGADSVEGGMNMILEKGREDAGSEWENLVNKMR